MGKIVVQLRKKRVRIGIVINNDVLAVHERPRVRRVHLVDEDQCATGKSLKSPEVALPVRRVARHYYLRPPHGVEVDLVDHPSSSTIYISRDAFCIGMLLEVVVDPTYNTTSRRLALVRSIATQDVDGPC